MLGLGGTSGPDRKIDSAGPRRLILILGACQPFRKNSNYLTISRTTSISKWRVLPGTSSEPSITGLPGVSIAVF
jgi:hypothetical protein